MNEGFEALSLLERTGALRLLVLLLDGDLYISQLINRGDGAGVASQPAIEKTRTALTSLGLIEEYERESELTQKKRLYLRLTDKGRKVAEQTRGVLLALVQDEPRDR